MTIPTIRGGEPISLVFEIRSVGAFEDPAPEVTVVDPLGKIRVDGEPMLRLHGDYYGFSYETPTDGPVGIWAAYCEAGRSTSPLTPSFRLV